MKYYMAFLGAVSFCLVIPGCQSTSDLDVCLQEKVIAEEKMQVLVQEKLALAQEKQQIVQEKDSVTQAFQAAQEKYVADFTGLKDALTLMNTMLENAGLENGDLHAQLVEITEERDSLLNELERAKRELKEARAQSETK